MSRAVLGSFFILIGCGSTVVLDDAAPIDARQRDDAALLDAVDHDAVLDIQDAAPDDAGATCGVRVASGSEAVAYQIDPAHTGAQLGDTVSMPLCRRWTADLHGAASYALVADGRVFATVSDDSVGTLSLYALDASTGATLWGPVDILGETFPWANAAYDAGRVFVVNGDGDMVAFDARTGAEQWRIDLPVQYSFGSPPTARAGRVFASGSGYGGTLYGVSQADGTLEWSAAVVNGDDSSPAVTDTAVFVSYACNQTYSFDPVDGTLNWHHAPDCSGGGGRTVGVAEGRVYARDFVLGNLVFDALDGAERGTFRADAMPALADGVMYAVADGALTATPLDGGPMLWSFGGGDVPLYGAPLVVGSLVFATSERGLFAVDRADGVLVSSDALAGIRTVKTAYVGAPDAGLAAADGLLLVPTATGLVAY